MKFNRYVGDVIDSPRNKKRKKGKTTPSRLQERLRSNTVDQIFECPAQTSGSTNALSPEGLRANARLWWGTSESSKFSDLYPLDWLASRIPIMSLQVRMEWRTTSTLRKKNEKVRQEFCESVWSMQTLIQYQRSQSGRVAWSGVSRKDSMGHALVEVGWR